MRICLSPWTDIIVTQIKIHALDLSNTHCQCILNINWLNCLSFKNDNYNCIGIPVQKCFWMGSDFPLTFLLFLGSSGHHRISCMSNGKPSTHNFWQQSWASIPPLPYSDVIYSCLNIADCIWHVLIHNNPIAKWSLHACTISLILHICSFMHAFSHLEVLTTKSLHANTYVESDPVLALCWCGVSIWPVTQMSYCLVSKSLKLVRSLHDDIV